jgi:hypothetical protein
MNALAANERWTVSRRLLGPLESMQRDAIVQSLLDYHGSKVKTAESPGGCPVPRSTARSASTGSSPRPANRPCDPVPAQPQNGIMPPSPTRNLPPEPAAAPSPATIQAPGPGPGTRRRAARPGNR